MVLATGRLRGSGAWAVAARHSHPLAHVRVRRAWGVGRGAWGVGGGVCVLFVLVGLGGEHT